MTDSCVPPKRAKDGSLHWVEHPEHGKRAWQWIGGPLTAWRTYRFGVYTETAGEDGWRYIGPASPDDAQALAEARAEYSALLTSWGELKVMKSELIQEKLDLDAQIAALTAANEALRADAERFQWLMSHVFHIGKGQHRMAVVFPNTSFGTVFDSLRNAIDREIAVLAQASGGDDKP